MEKLIIFIQFSINISRIIWIIIYFERKAKNAFDLVHFSVKKFRFSITHFVKFVQQHIWRQQHKVRNVKFALVEKYICNKQFPNNVENISCSFNFRSFSKNSREK